MKILLISTNRNQLPMPVMPIGACIVAQAAEQAGHTVFLLDLMFAKDPPADIQAALTRWQPDAVALSVRNIDNVDMRNPLFFLDGLQGIVQTVRSGSCAPIILGGAALGIMPEQILRLVPDCVAVIGDGELVFPQLLDRISRDEHFRDLPGIARIEKGVFQLNSSAAAGFSATCPAPDYQRWLNIPAYRSRMATVPIQTKTGCRYQCVYCTYPKIEGNSCRLKDPGSIADAVVRFAAAGLRDIEFVDSVFNAPLEHAMAVCAALARVKHHARLQCLELNPRDFDDELVSAMERAGFAGMGITLESASDPVLQGLRKGFTSRDVQNAAVVVARHRIPCAWVFLFGGPGETPETVRETLLFARKHIRPGDVAFFNSGIRIYPGTELESIARTEGLLTRPAEEMLAPLFYLSPEVDAEWLDQELKNAMNSQMNFINMAAMGHALLPAIHRISYLLGLRPPLWRHTGIIRRVLRLAGMDV
ncbi:MAG: cobalamin B12-binding domain-containing protein [Steroidobacteraceae bacterium]|nr:cobalamin B12-binding domain-containing protein [Deltaproteobacteria bacterium]